MNRRDFVVRGAAAAAAIGMAQCAVALASKSAPAGAVRGALPYKVIFDARFDACRAFAAGAARLGCPVQRIAGDVTALWFNELQPHWARGEGSIVGMTTGTSLFCLEQLAWGQWMRVRARIEHWSGPDGTLRHRLLLPDSILPEATAALAGDARWPERLAGPLVNGLSVSRYRGSAERVVCTRSVSRDDPRPSLVSWIIATPATRVRAV